MATRLIACSPTWFAASPHDVANGIDLACVSRQLLLCVCAAAAVAVAPGQSDIWHATRRCTIESHVTGSQLIQSGAGGGGVIVNTIIHARKMGTQG